MGWQDFYTTGGNDFGILPNSRFYGAQGHRGKDFIHGVDEPIPAYEDGRVAAIEHSSFIGWCIVVELADHLFAGWAHTKLITVGVGATVTAGMTIAHVAGADDDPGSSWAGAHSHTTLGPSVDSIFSGTVFDPVPRIRGAIGAAPAFLLEDDMYESADRTRDENIYAGLYKGASVLIDGTVQRFNYGVLPIVAHNQNLIAQQAGRIAALEETLRQVVAAQQILLDHVAIDAAADEGNRLSQNDLPVVEPLENIDGIDVIRTDE